MRWQKSDALCRIFVIGKISTKEKKPTSIRLKTSAGGRASREAEPPMVPVPMACATLGRRGGELLLARLEARPGTTGRERG